MIPLAQLWVTQNGLRKLEQLTPMVEFLKRGGSFTKDALLAFRVATWLPGTGKLVHIAELPDRRWYIHDGHHRMVAMWLAGRNCIHKDEYELVNYSYRDYSTPNFKKQWYTPFNLISECRVADLTVFRLGLAALDNDEDRLRYINTNAWQFKAPRQFQKLQEMAEWTTRL